MLEAYEARTGPENVPLTIDTMLEAFRQQKQEVGEKMVFEGTEEGKDVYNTTAPFEFQGERYIIGRVESAQREDDSQSVFFIDRDGVWCRDESTAPLPIQDPFVTQIDGEMIVGGVLVFPKDQIPIKPDELSWRNVYYRGNSLTDLKEFAQSPLEMKGLRIIELPNGKIGVFTRPGSLDTRAEDNVGGLIGYTEIDSLDELTEVNIEKAQPIEGLFTNQEWGGSNELYLLENNRIGVLGHIARHNEKEDKEYFVITFEFDPSTKQVFNKRIVAERDNFPEGKSKELKGGKNPNTLRNIVYPGGMTSTDDVTELYAGLSDSEAGKITIKYPFSSPLFRM